MTLFFHQLRGELHKLFARKRTYIGFGAYIGLEIIILLLFQIHSVQRGFRRAVERLGGVFDYYFSALTLALIILLFTFLLTMLYLALVGGDVVAKEVEDGTLRMTLCRPISRLQLLLVKYFACVIYTFALIFFIGITAVITGRCLYPWGGLFVVAPEHKITMLFTAGEGAWRFAAAVGFYSMSFLSITTLAFALSCFNMKPATATISTLSYFVMDWIFFHLPYFETIKKWFITGHMTTWANIFAAHVPRQQMIEDYAYILAVDFTLIVVAILNFHRRDFKS